MSTRTDTTDFDFEHANFCVLVRQKTYQKISLRTECIWPWAYYIDARYKQKGVFRGLTSPEEVQEMLRVVKMAKFCSGDHALRLEYHIVIWLFFGPRPYTFRPQADFLICFLSYQNAKIGMLEIGHVGPWLTFG